MQTKYSCIIPPTRSIDARLARNSTENAAMVYIFRHPAGRASGAFGEILKERTRITVFFSSLERIGATGLKDEIVIHDI